MAAGSQRILVVDDEPSLLRILSIYLTRLGYLVSTSDTTEGAWQLFEADPGAFSVAVLDGSMAGITMEDLALRMLRANPALRVLAASGYPLDVASIEKEAPGRVNFLQKPFTPEKLDAAIRGLLGPKTETV